MNAQSEARDVLEIPSRLAGIMIQTFVWSEAGDVLEIPSRLAVIMILILVWSGEGMFFANKDVKMENAIAGV